MGNRGVYVTCPMCGNHVKVGDVDPDVGGILLRDPADLKVVQKRVGDECRYLETMEH